MNISPRLFAADAVCVVDKTYSHGVIMAALIVIHNFAVLGLFALENITMAKFSDRVIASPDSDFQRLGGAIGGWLLARPRRIFVYDRFWLPILIMLVLYSLLLV